MHININDGPPTNISNLRWKYTMASMFFLGLAAIAIILGVISVVFTTGYDDMLQNTSFILFVASGFTFVYFVEKLLGYRRIGPERQKKLTAMMYAHAEISEYCRKVAEQGRYLVVVEYDALVNHVQENKGKMP